MNADDQMKMKMLDELEAELDGHDQKTYTARMDQLTKKSGGSLSSGEKEKIVDKENDPFPRKETGGSISEREKRFYMDPSREKQLNDAMQSRANDPILMRGQFAKRKA